jgi:hypothetical protein
MAGDAGVAGEEDAAAGGARAVGTPSETTNTETVGHRPAQREEERQGEWWWCWS